jgi:phosphoribosyl-ATP pyrophosphohydrolase
MKEITKSTIELKNIDLSGISVLVQLDKVKEEEKEFMVAIELADKENAIEEFWDNMQSKLGLLDKIFGVKAYEVMDEYKKHLEKIKNRPRK